MSDDVLHFIKPEDYAVFQGLVKGLPATYEDWHKRHIEEKRARERWASPERVRLITLSPAGFEVYWELHGAGRGKATEQDLYRCAIHTGAPG